MKPTNWNAIVGACIVALFVGFAVVKTAVVGDSPTPPIPEPPALPAPAYAPYPVPDDAVIIETATGRVLAPGEDMNRVCAVSGKVACRKWEPEDLASLCASHPQSPPAVAKLCADYFASLEGLQHTLDGIAKTQGAPSR